MRKSARKVLMSVMMAVLILVIGVTISKEVKADQGKLKIVVKKEVSVKLTGFETVKVKVYYNGKNVTKDSKLKFVSSNKKVVKVCKAENSNYEIIGFEAWPKKKGTSKITISAKYRPYHWSEEELDDVYDGPAITKKVKCKVKAEYYDSLRAYSKLQYYDTRNNLFCMKVYNISKKTITINSSGAAVYDDDYRAYDRKLRLTRGRKTQSIKPGETQKVYFSVLGGVTWYDVYDFQLCSNWKWGGKTYRVSVDDSETYLYKGGKWVWAGFAIHK